MGETGRPELPVSLEQAQRLAHRVSQRVFLRSGRRVSLDDLRSEAWVALLRCARNYQPGPTFTAFAYPRIRVHLERWLGARYGPGWREKFLARVGKGKCLVRHSLNAMPHVLGRLHARDANLQNVDNADYVSALLSRLPPRERTIFMLQCVDEMSLADIAPLVGVTRERIRQIIEKTAGKLRRLARRLRGDFIHWGKRENATVMPFSS